MGVPEFQAMFAQFVPALISAVTQGVSQAMAAQQPSAPTPIVPVPATGSNATPIILPLSSVSDGNVVDPGLMGNGPRSDSHHGRPLIARFSGSDQGVRIEAWISLYEVVMSGKTDAEKVKLLLYYLDSDAITWFSEDIAPRLDSHPWNDVKSAMIARFGQKVVRPIIAAQSRYLQRTETIKQYYDEKMRLLRQTGLEEIDMAAMLTSGMPGFFKSSLVSAQIRAPQQWLAVALELESAFKVRKPMTTGFGARPEGPYPGSQTQGQRPPMQATYLSSAEQKSKEKKKPTKPCKYCKNLGKTLFHWHAECENNTSRQTNRNEVDAETYSASASGNEASGQA